jgi:uncharacterized protein YndB with AHSA1/START domain
MFALRAETLEFIEQAPLSIRESLRIDAPPERVFEALADTASWPRWFPLMTRCSWVDPSRTGLGAVREVSLVGLGVFRERFIAWTPGERFAFTMTEASGPFARALCEDFRLRAAPGGGATQIDWTLAAELRLLGRLARPALEATMRRVVRRAAQNLERDLRKGRSM